MEIGKIASAERDELPIGFGICDFEPRHARWRTAVWPGHASRIEKQNIPASFIARNVRMPMQQYIGIAWEFVRRDMLKTESQSAAHKIDN